MYIYSNTYLDILESEIGKECVIDKIQRNKMKLRDKDPEPLKKEVEKRKMDRFE